MESFSIKLTPLEAHELLAGCGARSVSLDKVFKSAAKAGVQGAMDKVAEKMKIIKTLDERIRDALPRAE